MMMFFEPQGPLVLIIIKDMANYVFLSLLNSVEKYEKGLKKNSIYFLCTGQKDITI